MSARLKRAWTISIRGQVTLNRALREDFPPGKVIDWRHGRARQRGIVEEHGDAMVRARNERTGRLVRVTVFQILEAL